MFAHFVTRSLHDLVRQPALKDTTGQRKRSTMIGSQRCRSMVLRSIDVCGGRASSKGYRFLKGWMPPYPETSGYIIPTLLLLGREIAQTEECTKRARAIGECLLGIQQPNGGFIGGEVGRFRRKMYSIPG